ncbi:MAG: type I phosphomannose isomerase catalytic subunit [Phycisphaerales bacterium]
MSPYPLILKPILMPKVWGGERLARLGKAVKAGERIGESWEVADLEQTSPSGAGGAAARSMIENGPMAGKTLHDAMSAFGERGMLGEASGDRSFPLLVKYLDARENLSVQVHPSIAYAKAHPGAHIKTECWYIVEAEPGSVIYKGVRAGVTREEFGERLREGDGSRIIECLETAAAIPGEMHNLPSGTVHALGAGVVVAEVQTPSDTTFRVHDWGRAGRELHVDAAMECITFGPAREASRGAPGETVSRLVSTGFFVVDEIRGEPGARLEVRRSAPGPARAMVLMWLSGAGAVEHDRGDVPMRAGRTVVVPAAAAEGAWVRFETPSVVLRAVVMSG